jgi:hypothetical protein
MGIPGREEIGKTLEVTTTHNTASQLYTFAKIRKIACCISAVRKMNAVE